MSARRSRSATQFINRPVLRFSDLARLCRDRPGATVPAGSGTASFDYAGSGGRGSSWDGGLNLAGAAMALERGWAEGNVAVSQCLDVLDLDVAPTGGWDLDVAGEYASIPDFITGAPDCMYRKDAGESQTRLRVVMFACMSASVPASAGLEFAKANAAFCAIMLARGFDVAVNTVDVVGTGSQVVIKPVTVKEYGQEADASRIAFASHPAFLRRVMFCAMEMDGEVPVQVRAGSYGHPPYRCDEQALRAALGADATDGERMVLLPNIESLNYHGGHEAMLKEIMALVSDQAMSRGDDGERL